MKKLSQTMVCAAAFTAMGMSSVALAESPLTGNVGVTSNYIWRGATQANDEAAISGGIDYAHDSGLYAGTWVSSLGGDVDTTDTDGSGQYEQDYYVGFGGEAGPMSYGISYVAYTYPVGKAELDFAEVILSLGYGPVTFTYAPTVDKEVSGTDQDDVYMSLAAEFEVRNGLTLGVLYGDYDYDGGSADDYTHYQVSLAKDDFVFAYDVMDPETDDPTDVKDAPRFSVSWVKSFDL